MDVVHKNGTLDQSKMPYLASMKITITDDCFTYQVDWSLKNTVDGGFIEEYHPDLEECIEALLQLLENIYSREKISAYFKQLV